MVNEFYLIVLLPLAGFLVNGILGYRIKNEKISGIIGSGTVFLSFLITAVTFFQFLSFDPGNRTYTIKLYQWVSVDNFSAGISYLIDPLSLVMCLIVTGVGFLIHVYSIGYMHGDRGFARFFSFMNLFIFSMLNLVLADNFLLMFLGWEGVGLCSYLLIGFWYEKSFTGDAANKAFWVNRIGDAGFLIALFFIISNFHTLNFGTLFGILKTTPVNTGLLTATTILLLVGATGKSAQIPLYVWLPDAMAGPTPVSALIHAATMVTAGVYLLARCSLMFALSPITMELVLIIGSFTAFFAATIAIAQNDIKKILAYSTISQIGYMFMAMGSGAFSSGIFHVTTHAYFKALMFLAAGSVIHSMHDEQDITQMGGLKNKMKVTYLTFLMGAIAISGIPPFSGFFSKDEILSGVFAGGNYFFYILSLITAFMTAFYIFRLISLTFFGHSRYDTETIHPHESPKVMTIPLIILAVLSVIGGFVGLPQVVGSNLIENFLNPVFESSKGLLPVHELTSSVVILLIIISVIVAVVGIFLSLKSYAAGRKLKLAEGWFYRTVSNKYYIDEFYNFIIVKPIKRLSDLFYSFLDLNIIDGIVNGSGRFFLSLSTDWRKLQTGVIQDYAVISIAGIILILLYLILLV
ncbi:MAG: NADH-quinone oxidoreductase subunit L [Ignavibacteria bacterium]|jgi:NADH-quinone oxidoreductase subunit L